MLAPSISPVLVDSLPSDESEAPDNLNSLHPICIEKAFSVGSERCPFRAVVLSVVRRTVGILKGAGLPFAAELERNDSIPAVFSMV